MKSSAIVCAIAAACMGFGSLSFAQGNNRGGRGNDRQDRQEQRNDRDGRDYGPPGFNRPQARNDRNDRQFDAHGPQFRRGGRMPQEYRGNQYVVNDWRGHHLSAPPRGQQWVQVGADYVLVAIATGLIVQLLLNN